MANSAKILDALMSNAAKQRKASGPIRAQRETGPGLRAPRSSQGKTGKLGSEANAVRARQSSPSLPGRENGDPRAPSSTSPLDQHGLGDFFGAAGRRVPAARSNAKNKDSGKGHGGQNWRNKNAPQRPKETEANAHDGIDMDWAAQEDIQPGEELGARKSNSPDAQRRGSPSSARGGSRSVQHGTRNSASSGPASAFFQRPNATLPAVAKNKTSAPATQSTDPQLLAAKARMQALLQSIGPEDAGAQGPASQSTGASLANPARSQPGSNGTPKPAAFGRDVASFLTQIGTSLENIEAAPRSESPGATAAPDTPDASAAGLPDDEAVLPKMRRGRNGEMYQPRALPKEEALQLAKRKGVDLLSRSELSAKTLIERISRDERLAPFAQAAAAELQRLGFQSDERYATVRARMRLSSRSRRFTERELVEQGISVEMIATAMDAALQSWDVESDTDLLARSFARRFGPKEPANNALRDKQTRWYLSRGYGYDQLKTVWAMARRGELDVWAVSDVFLSALLDPAAVSAGEAFQVAAGAPAIAESASTTSTESESRSDSFGARARSTLDDTALAELGVARERKFGEAAPPTPAQREKEKRWLMARGATFEQIKELWSDAANNAALRESTQPASEQTQTSSASDPFDEEESTASFHRRGASKVGDFETFYTAWMRKFGRQPDSDKEKARQSGWAARQGASFAWLKQAWTQHQDTSEENP